ncbi:MAG TPA: hypothetical protein VIG89_00020 [Candidatus Acidoferrales bacterium]|nr:hypothetical protein [bacterium]
MADRVRVMDYFYVVVPDKPGVGASVLGQLKDTGVYQTVIHSFPTGRRAQIDFFPSNAAAFKAAARNAGWKATGPKKALVIDGADRTGVLVRYFDKLGKAKINVTAASALAAGAGRFGAVLWVKQRDVKRAAKALGAG